MKRQLELNIYKHHRFIFGQDFPSIWIQIMKRKYNLALIPQTQADNIICFARRFSGIADQYILGKNSNPHVTLYQFEMEEAKLNDFWQRINEDWKEMPIILEFNKLNCVTFDNLTYWVSLMPTQITILHKMHSRISDMIRMPLKKNFDPHMTLINSKNKASENEIQRLAPLYHSITDAFV